MGGLQGPLAVALAHWLGSADLSEETNVQHLDCFHVLAVAGPDELLGCLVLDSACFVWLE